MLAWELLNIDGQPALSKPYPQQKSTSRMCIAVRPCEGHFQGTIKASRLGLHQCNMNMHRVFRAHCQAANNGAEADLEKSASSKTSQNSTTKQKGQPNAQQINNVQAKVSDKLKTAVKQVDKRVHEVTAIPVSQNVALAPYMHEHPEMFVSKPLPRCLLIHTGGTLGMDPGASYEPDALDGHIHLKRSTGGSYSPAAALRPGSMLDQLLFAVPELRAFANLKLEIPFNLDSSRVGPAEWVKLARLLHQNRDAYDAFLIVHGTDTMAYTAAALSFMLAGFKKPVVMTGSQLPLAMPRSDARQNLIDSVTCATAFFTPPHVLLQEVAVCFGGRLMRGNRAQKVHSNSYRAFDSINHAPLATLGVDVEWNTSQLLQVNGVYRPRFKLDTRVIRVPVIPGLDPRTAYGNLAKRDVKGIVLESFGVGNMPDLPKFGWLPWLKTIIKEGVKVYLSSQCMSGDLQPELYRAGTAAINMGVEGGPRMTPEAAVVKMMFCLAHPDIPMGVAIAGEI